MSGRSPSGVASLRARFEQNAESPSPSRGRSPAGSDFSDRSRPLSKVRTSFVSVDSSGRLGDSLGVKDMDGASNPIAADVAEESKENVKGQPQVNGSGGPTSTPKEVAEIPIKTEEDQEASNASLTMPENPDDRTTPSTLAAANPDKSKSAVGKGRKTPTSISDSQGEGAVSGEQAPAEDTTGLGSILKGSAFEKDEAKKGPGSQKPAASGVTKVVGNAEATAKTSAVPAVRTDIKAKEPQAGQTKPAAVPKTEQPAPSKTQAAPKPEPPAIPKPKTEPPAPTKAQSASKPDPAAVTKPKAEASATVKPEAVPKSEPVVATKPKTEQPVPPKAEPPAKPEPAVAAKPKVEQVVPAKTQTAPKPDPVAAPKPASKEIPKAETVAKAAPVASKTAEPKPLPVPSVRPRTPTSSTSASKEEASSIAPPKAPAATKDTNNNAAKEATKEPGKALTKDAKPQPRASEAAKPTATKPVSEHAKNDAGDAGHSREAHGNGTAASKPASTASKTTKPPTKSVVHPPHASAFTKPKPRSPTRPVKLPSHLTAPTAAFAAKHGDQSHAEPHKAPQTKPVHPVSASQPQQRKPPRASMPAAGLKPVDKEKPRPRISMAGVASKAPEGSFLERMMRPTASSAQKTHEKIDVGKTSPPRKVPGNRSASGSLIKPVSEHAKNDASDAGHRREAHGKGEAHESGLGPSEPPSTHHAAGSATGAKSAHPAGEVKMPAAPEITEEKLAGGAAPPPPVDPSKQTS